MTHSSSRALGFTLIEMLTVLLILSIIALVAYPNYISYLYQSNRLDAMNSLFHYQGQWQACMYDLPNAQACLQQIQLGSGQAQPSLLEHYAISADESASVVVFIAKAIEKQTHDSVCAQFSLDSQGLMQSFNANHEETTRMCW